MAVLFADMRGSTSLAERIGPAAFAETLNRFYQVATEILISNNAIIDKMVGDEIMALFIPSVCRGQHRRRAAEGAVALISALQSVRIDGQSLPVGIGVHAGLAFVGKIGTESVHDFTALGDTVNAAARLQTEASAGEVVVSEAISQASPEKFTTAEAREVTLRGKTEPLAIRVFRQVT